MKTTQLILAFVVCLSSSAVALENNEPATGWSKGVYGNGKVGRLSTSTGYVPGGTVLYLGKNVFAEQGLFSPFVSGGQSLPVLYKRRETWCYF
jgi:hypothetical protein